MITIPTLSTLYTAILADIAAEYGVSVSPVGKAMLRALAAAQAARLKLYYISIAGLQKNLFVDTADPEAQGGTLERFGRVKLGRNPFPAIAGQYTIQITGSIGAVVPASTTFKSNDDALNAGKIFILDAEYELVATTDTITVRALDAGVGSTLEVSDSLTATAPIINVDRTAVVTAEVVAPTDAEDIEAYREAIIAAYQLEPQGGARTDYRLWAADAAGVAKVYPYVASGESGIINLYVEAVGGIDGHGTPSAALLTNVEAVIELDPDTTKPIEERGRRPMGAFIINYLPISAKQVTINIPSSSFTDDEKTVIRNALKRNLIDLVRPFIAGADIEAERNDTLDINKIAAAVISAKPGAVFGTPTMTVAGVSLVTKTFTNGDIPWIDNASITFV